ncbi:MAG TPA: hypothetical protein VMI75_30145 [Polyangiaceae bacterium]|nr:hypothetical protein [Polyangiaceae bacterium]
MQPSLWGQMLADLLQPAMRLGVVLAFGATCGCSLNPQPLPPGEGPDAGGGSQSLDATAGNGDGSAGFGSGDAGGGRLDASMDALPSVPGADAGDAESDAPGDGPGEGGSDGPYDGPTDGGSEDGE